MIGAKNVILMEEKGNAYGISPENLKERGKQTYV
jgi:hypothetical protein